MVNYPKHLAGFAYVGLHRYFLTFCTHGRQPLFADPGVVLLVSTQILRAAAMHAFDVTAYCFMPDHVHLVVEGRQEGSDLRAFLARAKQYSGFEYARNARRKKLWQRYSFERVLRTNEATQMVVRYVLENPVRRGIVEHPQQYEFIGSSIYTMSELLEFAFAQAPRGISDGSESGWSG